MNRNKGKRTEREWPCQKCGWCCEYFLMDIDLVNENRHLFQRSVKKEHIPSRYHGEKIIVVTDTPNRKCVFLKDNNECAIYENRPDICKMFGLSGGEYECPKVAPNGRIRSPEEVKRATKRIDEGNAKRHGDFLQKRGYNAGTILYEDESI